VIDPYIADALGDDFTKKIAAATALDKDDAVARFRTLHSHDARGIGDQQPENYWYKEVGYFWRVQGFADSGTLDGDDRASTLVVRRMGLLACRVPWRVAIAIVRALLRSKNRAGRGYCLVATSDDGAYGFVFTSYVGYVVRELHDDETVYKVSRWHPLAG
jgi:hypothetical protein